MSLLEKQNRCKGSGSSAPPGLNALSVIVSPCAVTPSQALQVRNRKEGKRQEGEGKEGGKSWVRTEHVPLCPCRYSLNNAVCLGKGTWIGLNIASSLERVLQEDIHGLHIDGTSFTVRLSSHLWALVCQRSPGTQLLTDQGIILPALIYYIKIYFYQL